MLFNEFGVPNETVRAMDEELNRKVISFLDRLVAEGATMGEVRAVGGYFCQTIINCVAEAVLTSACRSRKLHSEKTR